MSEFKGLDHVFREEYLKSSLLEKDINLNPFNQFNLWFNDIIKAHEHQPNAMTLSTSNKNGMPSSRIVLLKDMTENGFVFFTNYNSIKAQNINENPQGSLLFFSMELERQIHIQGSIKKISRKDSNNYFKSRPFESCIAAIASHQSDTITSRKELEASYHALLKDHEHTTPECPDFWGGYILTPSYFEFWQGRPNRLHDRICYTLIKNKWETSRKAP